MEFRSSNGEMPTLEQFRQRFPQDAALAKYLSSSISCPSASAAFDPAAAWPRRVWSRLSRLGRQTRTERSDQGFPARSDGSPITRGEPAVQGAQIAKLRHPGLVTVYGVQQDDDGDEFLVLEYVDGRSLEDLLRGNRISPQETARLILEVVQACSMPINRESYTAI